MTDLQSILSEQFLGKKVILSIPMRDESGKESKRMTTTIGKCTYIGDNEILGWALQVTIDRTPYEVKHINDIELV